jgi:CheY-like chemotaxis protein
MRILVVDDEKIISSVLQRVLAKAGHEVAVGNHGMEAIRLINEATQPFEACFLDLLMPEISGATVLDLVRQKMPQARVFMMTAYGDVAVREDLINRGATKVLAKPFEDVTKIPELLK